MRTSTPLALAAGLLGLALLTGTASAAGAPETGMYGRVAPRARAPLPYPPPAPFVTPYAPGVPNLPRGVPGHLARTDIPGPGAVFPVEGNENFPERPINRAEPYYQRGSGKQTGGYARELLPQVGPLWPFY